MVDFFTQTVAKSSIASTPGNEVEEQTLLSTAQVASQLGVGVSTVKRWADSGVLPCARTAGRHRRFRVIDVDAFRRRRLTDDDDAVDHTIDALLLSGTIHEVVGRMFSLRAELGNWVEVASLLGSVLQTVGQRWAAGELSVLEEHAISERLARGVGYVAESLPVGPRAPRALLMTVSGEEHTLGLLLAELVMREQGWSCVFAGRRAPLLDVKRFVDEGWIESIGVSASIHSHSREELRNEYEQLRAITEPKLVSLTLGGAGAWPEDPPYGFRVRDLAAFARLLVRPSPLERP